MTAADDALAGKLASLSGVAEQFNATHADAHELRTTELDDALEQILARYVPHVADRISARNDIVAVLVAAGVDIDQQVPAPKPPAPRRNLPLPE